MAEFHQQKYGDTMGRRNQGPKCEWFEKRKCYYIFWTENGRSRERSTGTADSAAAQIVFAEWLQRRTRRAGPRDPNETLVTDVLTDYLTAENNKGKDVERAAYAAVPLSDYFAGRTVQEAPTHVDSYVKWRGRSIGTARRELGVLRAAVNDAHAAQILTRSVVFELPAEPPSKERWLTRTEAAMLLAGALGFMPVAFDIKTRLPMKWSRVSPPQYHLALFILIGLYTGRRKEAILSLRWPKVDLQRGQIDFRRTGVAETKKRRGRCAISRRLLAHLIRARRFEHDLGPVISWHGEPVTDIKTGFAAAVERTFLIDVTPHTLKHTAASWLMQSGKDPWKIAEFLATSLTTLLKVYGHHHPDHQEDIAESFGRRPQNVRRIQ